MDMKMTDMHKSIALGLDAQLVEIRLLLGLPVEAGHAEVMTALRGLKDDRWKSGFYTARCDDSADVSTALGYQPGDLEWGRLMELVAQRSPETPPDADLQWKRYRLLCLEAEENGFPWPIPPAYPDPTPGPARRPITDG